MRNVKAWLRRTTSGEMHHHDRGFGYDPITKSESQTRNPKFRIAGRYIAGSPNQQCPAELRSRCLMRYSPHSTMINDDAVTAYIRALLPDATVRVTDKTGTKDHLMVRVTSSLFQDKTLLDRHRTIYQALAAPMRDGRIHALEITATTPDELQGGPNG
jgi:stress-induced morphogen